MKQTKKFMSLLLAFVMVLSLTNGLTVKTAEAATSTITVTLRVEQDKATMVPPTKVTLTEADLTKDYGIEGVSKEKFTAIHVLLKYLTETKNVAIKDLGKYLFIKDGFLKDFSAEGDVVAGDDSTPGSNHALVSGSSLAYFAILSNNEYSDFGISQLEVKDSDSIALVGVSYSAGQSFFDKDEYSVETGSELSLTLSNYYYDSSIGEWGDTVKGAVDSATILATEYVDETTTATSSNATIKATTDKDGLAKLTFPKAGKYVLSAEKLDDSKAAVISRPYAIVTVTDKKTDDTKVSDTKTDSSNKADSSSGTTDNSATVKKPSKVKNLKAKVAKKFKKNKKSVKLTWKKTSNAKGYQVYISKKKKSGYKKTATVTKAKTTLKLKKGTYYVKIRAYNKSGSTTKKGTFSSPVKVKIKK